MVTLSARLIRSRILTRVTDERAWSSRGVLAAALLIFHVPPPVGAQSPPTPILNVVLIDGQDMGRPLLVQFQNELRRTLAERNGGRLSFFLESADVSRFPGSELSRDFDQWLHQGTKAVVTLASAKGSVSLVPNNKGVVGIKRDEQLVSENPMVTLSTAPDWVMAAIAASSTRDGN